MRRPGSSCAAVVTAVAGVLIWQGSGEAAGGEPFRRVRGTAIAKLVSGFEFTDEVHWAFVFERGGTLRGFALGQKGSGTWRVVGDELCLEYGEESSRCHEVWTSGHRMELRREAAPAQEGVLQRPRPRNSSRDTRRRSAGERTARFEGGRTMTTGTDRRQLVQAAGTLAAAVAVGSATNAIAQADAPQTLKLPPYKAKPLPLDPQKISGMSERILISHYENNYVGAVNRLNSIADQLASLDYEKTPGFVINGLKREELIATNSMILHELFFAGLGDQSKPGPALEAAMVRDFGNVERWRAQFTAMGRAQGGGAGWVLMTYNPRDKRLVNAWAADHTTTLVGGTPILAMDMYEHAYQMDFGAKAASYVDVFMRVIRWETADRLFAEASRA